MLPLTLADSVSLVADYVWVLAGIGGVAGPAIGWMIIHERRITRTEGGLTDIARRVRETEEWRQRLEQKTDRQTNMLSDIVHILREREK